MSSQSGDVGARGTQGTRGAREAEGAQSTDRVPRSARITRSRLLRSSCAAGAGLLAACGVTRPDGSGAPALPSTPVELEYWHTNAETTPVEQGRMAALKAAEQANPGLFKMKFAEPGGASLTKVVAASAAGTPPNLKIDYPYNAAQLWIKGGLIDYDQQLKGNASWKKLSAAVPSAATSWPGS